MTEKVAYLENDRRPPDEGKVDMPRVPESLFQPGPTSLHVDCSVLVAVGVLFVPVVLAPLSGKGQRSDECAQTIIPPRRRHGTAQFALANSSGKRMFAELVNKY